MDAEQWDVYSKNYHDYIISPIKDSIENPLIDDLKKLNSSLSVADLGTGRGDLLPLLKRFKKVYAIDFSEKMIEAAKDKNFPNVEFYQQDLRKLSELGIKFDIGELKHYGTYVDCVCPKCGRTVPYDQINTSFTKCKECTHSVESRNECFYNTMDARWLMTTV